MNSYIQAKWKAARETCCQIGTTLATVQTNGKRNCMAQTAYSSLTDLEILINLNLTIF
jgi:hypothetical protein